MPLRMCMLARGAIRPCSTRMVFAFSPSTGMSDVSWASCTRSVVCCSSHPWILPYCEMESGAKAAVGCHFIVDAQLCPLPPRLGQVAAGCWLDMASGVYKYSEVSRTTLV